DDWIGWTPEQVTEHLLTKVDETDMKWLASMIEKGLNEIYLDDLLDPETTRLTRRHLRHPDRKIVESLREYSARERKLHHDNSSSAEHKGLLPNGQVMNEALWRTRAETPLFRSRRAEALATLLRAKLAIQSETGHMISAEEFRERLRSGEARQAIQSL